MGNGNGHEHENDKKVRTSLHTKVEKELLIKTKIRCLQDGLALNRVIEGLLRQWLHDKEKKS